MRCRPAGFRARRVLQQANTMVRREAQWILHALYCEKCDVRELALYLLSVAGLTEDEFFDEMWQQIVMEPPHA